MLVNDRAINASSSSSEGPRFIVAAVDSARLTNASSSGSTRIAPPTLEWSCFH